MFILSQCILHKCSSLTKLETISTYSIILGLIVYSTIYLYILFNNVDYIYIFNKFIIYIVGIDLLLSTFYYSMHSSTLDEASTPLLQENDVHIESDSETDDFFESAHEDGKDEEMEVDETELDETEVDETEVDNLEVNETEINETEVNEIDNRNEHVIDIGEDIKENDEKDQFEVNFQPSILANDITIEIKNENELEETLQQYNTDKGDKIEENDKVVLTNEKPKKNKRKGRPSKQSVPLQQI